MREPVASALLVHGAGGGGWEWAIWRGVLQAAGLVVAAPDLEPVPAGIAATRMQDYVGQMLEAQSRLPRPCAVVGASLGGLIAMLMASYADALVLVNPLPPDPWHRGLPSREWPGVVPWRRDARLASTRRASCDADDASALCAFRGWRDESGTVMNEACGGIIIEPPAIPVLCIASGDDVDVPSAVTRDLARAWNARLIEWPDTDHVGPLLGRHAAAVAAEVRGWLSAR